MQTFGLPNPDSVDLDALDAQIASNSQSLVGVVNGLSGDIDSRIEDNGRKLQRVTTRLTNAIDGHIRNNKKALQNIGNAVIQPVDVTIDRNQGILAGAMSDPTIAGIAKAVPVPPSYIMPQPPPNPIPTLPSNPPAETTCPPGYRQMGGGTCLWCPPEGMGVACHPIPLHQAWAQYYASQGNGSGATASVCTQPPPVLDPGWLGPYCPGDAPPPPPPPGYTFVQLGGGWIAYQPAAHSPPPPPPPPQPPPPQPPPATGGGGGAINTQGTGLGVYTTTGGGISGTNNVPIISGVGQGACRGPYQSPPQIPMPRGYTLVQDSAGMYWICPPGVQPPAAPPAAPPPPPNMSACPQTYTIVQGPPCPQFLAALGTVASWLASGYQLPAGWIALQVITDTPDNVQSVVNTLVQKCVAASLPSPPAAAGG